MSADNPATEPPVEQADVMPVPGLEGRYVVSRAGRVFSLLACRGKTGGELARVRTRYGYFVVGLYKARGRRVVIPVHRLVLEAFVGPCPPGREACHWDGNKANNHASNLRWGTPADNAQDRIRHGTHRRKLTDKDIKDLPGLAASMSLAAVAARLGVTKQAVLWRLKRLAHHRPG